MSLLTSKNFSLLCAVLNGAFALNAFSGGSWLFGLVCTVFCGYCLNNYFKG